MKIDEAWPSQKKVAKVWEPRKCIPQVATMPRLEVTSDRTTNYSQFMSDHALIGKNLGLWPSEHYLLKWIAH